MTEGFDSSFSVTLQWHCLQRQSNKYQQSNNRYLQEVFVNFEQSCWCPLHGKMIFLLHENLYVGNMILQNLIDQLIVVINNFQGLVSYFTSVHKSEMDIMNDIQERQKKVVLLWSWYLLHTDTSCFESHLLLCSEILSSLEWLERNWFIQLGCTTKSKIYLEIDVGHLSMSKLNVITWLVIWLFTL